MRTTIELKDEHRAALLELAARRGEKGFSGVVGEAIEAYLKFAEQLAAKRRSALAVQGTLSTQEARELRRKTSLLRKSWR